MLFAPDLFEFCAAASYLLWNDPTLYALSPFNEHPLDMSAAVLRCDIPGRFAFMATVSTLLLRRNAPSDMGWDEWIAQEVVRQDRFVLVPAVSRFTPINSRFHHGFVPFLEMDFRYLYASNYDRDLQNSILNSIEIQSISEIPWNQEGTYRIRYNERRHLSSQRMRMVWFEERSESRGGFYSWSYRGVSIWRMGTITVFVTCDHLWPCDIDPFSSL